MGLPSSCAASGSNVKTDASLAVSYVGPNRGTKDQTVQRTNTGLAKPLLYYQVCHDLRHDLG